jgi:tetratricopeptide (TPR) repeat protein
MTGIEDVTATLANVAFGDDPGRWPLPSASTPHQRWLRAVAAGGQGRYHNALAELAQLTRTESGSLASLAHSTRASFLRQLGWHARARGADGLAMAHRGTDPDAAADALVGLAADALGVGRFAASARLLERAQTELDEMSPRAAVRTAWVRAELAMSMGDGATAVAHAERGVAAAAEYGSTRHAIKSDVVLAAALCSAGRLDDARVVADDALQATGNNGMVPLRWALACLLADIGSGAHTHDEVRDIREVAADTVRRRGGVWSGR